MEHSIFALELCLHLDPDLRTRLHDLVLSHPAATSPGRKQDLLREISRLLVSAEHLFEMGCWDFFDSDDRALSDYDMWCNGMITEEGARKLPSGPASRGDARFMTFTISLLLLKGTRTEQQIAALCATPKDRLWKKETFLRILEGLDHVDYAFVKSDVLYLIPGDPSWGLTPDDLRDKKFEYLRQIA